MQLWVREQLQLGSGRGRNRGEIQNVKDVDGTYTYFERFFCPLIAPNFFGKRCTPAYPA